MRFRGFPAMCFGFGTPTTTPPFPLGTVVTNTLFPMGGTAKPFTVPMDGTALFPCADWHLRGGTRAGDVRTTGGGLVAPKMPQLVGVLLKGGDAYPALSVFP